MKEKKKPQTNDNLVSNVNLLSFTKSKVCFWAEFHSESYEFYLMTQRSKISL